MMRLGGISQEERHENNEGFYEKMWKDFVSLQRGDATLICKDAVRYRWLRQKIFCNETGYLDVAEIPCHWADPSNTEIDWAIDAAMTPNNQVNSAGACDRPATERSES